ncbi:MAG: hypothetical protein R2729_16445 [Bryobacteraceae bacterium]
MRRLAALVLASLAGCGRYADFTLPKLDGGPPQVEMRWETSPAPVMVRGEGGEWDSTDTLNPSVVRFADRWWNLYSGYDGKAWHTGVATSADGFAWRREGRILSPDAQTWEGDAIAANGAALVRGGEILYWYQAGDPPRIGLARSRDGRQWTRHGAPVLDLGPRGSWDERGVADPYAIERDGWIYLYFLGQDRARRQRLGLARSRDGIAWEKLGSNPILGLGEDGAFDENGLGEPAVWEAQRLYWMLYTGRDRHENRKMGLAWSRDGAHWKRHRESAVFTGAEPWDSRVVCDATVAQDNGRWRMWFGGGDVPHPAENIHGQIGHAYFTMEPAR